MQPKYRILVADIGTLARVATVDNADDINYSFEMNTPGSASFSVSVSDSLFDEVPDITTNPSKYAIIVERNDVRIWAGALFDWDGDINDRGSSITFTAKDWMQLLAYRVTTENLQYGLPAGAAPVDAGQIALDVIERQQRGQSMKLSAAATQFLVAPADNTNMIPNSSGANGKGFTVGCWIKPTTVGGSLRRIIRKALNDNISWELKLTANGAIMFDLGTGVSGTTYSLLQTPDGLISAGNIYSIIGVWKPGYQAIYVNGTLAAKNNASAPSSIYTGTQDLHIGSRNGNPFTEFYDGFIDDVFILGEALPEPVTVEGEKHAISIRKYNATDQYEMGRMLTPSNKLAMGEVYSLECWIKEGTTNDWSGFFSSKRVVSIGPDISSPSFNGSAVSIISYDDAGNDRMLVEVFGGEFAHVRDINVAWRSGWTHIAIVRETATSLKIYVNGTLVDSSNPTAVDYALSGDNKVVKIGNAQSGWEGQLDELRIFNRALTADEVTASYNAGSGTYGDKNAIGLVAGYHFDEGSKITEGSYRHKISDYSDNALDLDYGFYNASTQSDNPLSTSSPVYVPGKVQTLNQLPIHLGDTTPFDYDLRGYWRFDSGTSVKTYDYSGKSNHLSLGNTPIYALGIGGYIAELDMGIRAGTIQTTKSRDREYDLKGVMELIQQLCNVREGFDVWFAPDKKFYVYSIRGNDRPDIVFEWGKSFRSCKVSATTSNLVNQVLTIGQGSSQGGDTASPTTQGINVDSIRGAAGLRQKVITNPDVSEGVTLEQIATEAIRIGAQLQKIYSFTLLKNARPEFGTYGLGDRVRLIIKQGVINEDVIQRIYSQKVQVSKMGSEQVDLKLAGV